MVYPVDPKTAVLGRFDNMCGLTYNPGRTKVIWYADGPYATEWEVWNMTTRTYISSGTLDTTGVPRGAGTVTGCLTDDGYFYSVGTTLGGVKHLVRWSNNGAGTQEDMGAATIALQTSYAAMKAGNHHTYIGLTSSATANDGYIFDHTASSLTLLDTSTGTGFDWQIKSFILDGHGDIWAIGGRGDLAANKMAFWRVVNTSGISRTEYFAATMPAAQLATTMDGWGLHVLTSDLDHFVVTWPNNADGVPYTMVVDYGGAVSHVTTAISNDPFDGPPQFALHDPTASTIYIENVRYSLADLSLVATYPYSLWALPVGTVQQGALWDPTNNGFLAGYQNTNQNFAWLLFPPPVRKTATRAHIGRYGGFR